jgi:hypothetical protein
MNGYRLGTPLNSVLILSITVGLLCAGAQEAHAQTRTLPALNADPTRTSVSGLSSGGYMAVQFGVAFSSLIKGAGIIAGGPYFCAQGDGATATSTCSCPFLLCSDQAIDVSELIRITEKNSAQGRIDPTSNLASQRIWLFSGRADSVVPRRVMNALEIYYSHYVDRSAITYENHLNAQHALPTDSYGNACDNLGDPYINNCGYDAAGELLSAIYGPLAPRNEGPLGGDFVQFDQTEFLAHPISHGMDTTGWLYVPTTCRNNEPCRLHIAFHGCNQYQSYRYFQFGSGMMTFGTTFVRNAGYNKWADTNRIIVLYPQATKSPAENNFEGCWDWWGYDDPNYATKSGRQMSAVRSMMQRIATASTSGGAP